MSEEKNGLLRGVNLLGDAVRVTLGPKGPNVLIAQGGTTMFARAADAVAKLVAPDEQVPAMAVSVLRDAAARIRAASGDGFATTVVLAQTIFREGLKHLSAGQSVHVLNDNIERAAAKALAEIKRLSLPHDAEKLEQIAKIACKSDPKVGISSWNRCGWSERTASSSSKNRDP